MRDMKYEMQCIAEEISNEEFGLEFYNLTEEQQAKIWSRAEAEWNDRQADRADMLRKDNGIILRRSIAK